MYLPDMTKLINDVQRSKINPDDRMIVCSAVQDYFKKMHEIGALKGDYVAPVDKVVDKPVKKHLSQMNKAELLEEAKIVISARNTIMQHLVCEQKRKYRFFTIESPFENTCNHCKGAGEIYKFIKKTVDVNCHICGKKGIIKDDCPTCKGSGRFIKKWKTGGGVNLECKRCKGQKKIQVKCVNCLGEGTVKKAVLTHTLKSTTSCKKCNQLGYLPNKLTSKPKAKRPHKKAKRPSSKKVPFTPIMSQSLADKIKRDIEAQ